MKKGCLYYIYRSKITLKDGTVLIAKNYGLRAFRFPVHGDSEDVIF